MRNDASVPLPTFTDNRSIPLPTWGYGVAMKDLSKLQPMHEVLQQLLQTYFSRRIQPL
jgi:hypothetical protein